MDRKENLCLKCGAKAMDGFRICHKCAANMQKKKIQNRNYYLQHREALILSKRKRRRKYKEENRCIDCGRKLDIEIDGGGVKCINCAQRLGSWNRMVRRTYGLRGLEWIREAKKKLKE